MEIVLENEKALESHEELGGGLQETAGEEASPKVPDGQRREEDGGREPEPPAGADESRSGSMKVVLPEGPLETVVEALLFVSSGPVSLRRLAQTAGAEESAVKEALGRLRDFYRETGRAFEVLEIARGYQILSRPEFHEVIATFRKSKSADRLSASALETLAIVAYRQPIIRAEIEGIRGVQCGPMLRKLLDKRLIRAAGRSKNPGHPILYRTTSRFLEQFGLSRLKDLPTVKELKSPNME